MTDMRLSEILSVLESIAPLACAESWDNVGLLAGDPAQNIRRVVLTIDYTPAVAEEAGKLDCDLVVAYHPPLFSAVKRITANGPSSLIHDAIRRGVAIYSPHTAWDAAPGGTNDLLADAAGLNDRVPLREIPAASTDLKLVTFVPESHVQPVSDALFRAGGGRIGNYSSCSFRTAGTGTFFGEAGANPSVGQKGRLETQPEVRLEIILPRRHMQAAIAALRQTHPYEEPAFDLLALTAPGSCIGQGRIGNLPAPAQTQDLIAKLKTELGLTTLLVAGERNRPIQRIAVCAGSGGELLGDAIAAKADLYLTGELRHHDALKAVHAGLTAICTLHTNSERPSLKRLMSRLQQAAVDMPEVLLSQADADPFEFH
jgi:dinuclear metal center YbgI/SA1388 family protein